MLELCDCPHCVVSDHELWRIIIILDGIIPPPPLKWWIQVRLGHEGSLGPRLSPHDDEDDEEDEEEEDWTTKRIK